MKNPKRFRENKVTTHKTSRENKVTASESGWPEKVTAHIRSRSGKF